LNEKQEALTARNQMLTELYGATARAKVDAVIEYVLRALQVGRCYDVFFVQGSSQQSNVFAGDKFVVFGHHKEMLDALERSLQLEERKSGKEYIRIDGSTESSKRQALVNQFQTDPNCYVALLSMTAAGQGITLNKASFAIFAELFWTPGVLLQAEDRIHRIGQDTPVLIHYLVAKNTLDDRIWPILSSKLEVLGETLNGEEEQLEAEAAIALNNPLFDDCSVIEDDDVVEYDE